MQLYTKILIGMVVGAILGITLGPKSSFLDHDLYVVSDAGNTQLQRDMHDASSDVPIPARAKLDLKLIRTEETTATSPSGSQVSVPSFAQVRLIYDKQLSLLDKEGALSEALGGAKRGEAFELWLPLSHKILGDDEVIVSPEPVSGIGERIARWMSFIGSLFMRLIKLVIVPLVFSSIVVGVAGLGDVRKLGRLGSRTLGLYLCTTAIAVSIGMGLAHLIKPGHFMGAVEKASLVAQFEGDAGSKADAAASAPSAMDNILNIVPDNPVASMASGNMLQVIFFAILFGVALTLLKKERSKEVVSLLDTVQHAMILIIHMVMALAPYGVAALLAEVIGRSGVSILLALGVYSVTVIVGLLLHGTVVYGGLVRLWSKLPITSFLKAARPAQLIAFSTSSSSAALPVTMECAEENLGISNSVSSFVLPLGSTVNMDGTALYQGVAAIFIAQVFAVDLTIVEQLGIVLAATAASIGAAGVPGAGMITLTAVLTASGIPAVGVALILGADRILDMFRTAVNVTGDLAVTTVMAVSEGETLTLLGEREDQASANKGFERRLDKEPQSVDPGDDPQRP